MAYLLVFGLGTVAGMVLITTAIAMPFAHSRGAASHRRLQMAAGLVSIGFGLFIAYRIGFVEGLF